MRSIQTNDLTPNKELRWNNQALAEINTANKINRQKADKLADDGERSRAEKQGRPQTLQFQINCKPEAKTENSILPPQSSTTSDRFQQHFLSTTDPRAFARRNDDALTPSLALDSRPSSLDLCAWPKTKLYKRTKTEYSAGLKTADHKPPNSALHPTSLNH